MMIFSMDDVKVLIEFFRNHVVNIKRGAKVLLERIEDHEGLMTTSSVVDFTSINTNISVSSHAASHQLPKGKL